ncbi:MAG: hypothetical protein QJR09_05195 [Micrococcus sp.]|nr:hypothetical protein [Micrococcus sp.]
MNRRAAITLTTAAVLTGTAAAAVVIPAVAADPAGPTPAMTATAQAVRSTAAALSPEQAAVLTDPQVTTLTDPAAAKAAALEAGRPEEAWDKNCVAWKLPAADTDAQAWANDVAGTWLDAHEAGCPDAIEWPHYYAETFTAGEPGEIVITLEAGAIEDSFVSRFSDNHQGLQAFAVLFRDATEAEHPDLENVTVTVEGTDHAWTLTPDLRESVPYDAEDVSIAHPMF